MIPSEYGFLNPTPSVGPPKIASATRTTGNHVRLLFDVPGHKPLLPATADKSFFNVSVGATHKTITSVTRLDNISYDLLVAGTVINFNTPIGISYAGGDITDSDLLSAEDFDIIAPGLAP